MKNTLSITMIGQLNFYVDISVESHCKLSPILKIVKRSSKIKEYSMVARQPIFPSVWKDFKQVHHNKNTLYV